MRHYRIIAMALCAWLFLALAGCGNKGPLVLPDDEEEQQERQKAGSY